MVVTLLLILLIASLLFYVYNTGINVQGRIVTQNAADATAIGGAGQVARSMNTVAMNNVQAAHTIVSINLLDSFPLAVDLSVTDETETGLGDLDALAQTVRAQLRTGIVDAWLEHKLRALLDPKSSDSILPELDRLKALDRLFQTQPDLVPELTRYRAPSGKMGRMHQAMRSMDAQSRAVMAALAETASQAASRSGLANAEAEQAGVLLLPVEPTLPWQRGVFADYERPARFGLLPGADTRLKTDSTAIGFGQVDDVFLNRGPWDVLFGWRYTNAREARAGRIPVDAGAPPLTGRPVVRVQPEYYGVYGFGAAYLDALPASRYARIRNINTPVYSRGHLTDLLHTKDAFLWEQRPISRIRDTQWEIDIAFDGERSDDRNQDYLNKITPDSIRGSLFLVVEIKSRLRDEKGLPNARGVSWNYVDVPGRESPYVIYRQDWFDPDRPDGYRLIRNLSRNVHGPVKWRKIQDHVWRASAVYRTDPTGPELGGDPSIGLAPKRSDTNADGRPTYLAQEVFWEIDVMLVGANLGEEIVVDNPWAGFDPDAVEAPAPIDLVATELPAEDPEARWSHLTFLGIARQSNRSQMWPSRFDGNRPYPYNTAVAQARVFNNHSWDLWTQAWQAQLEPVNAGRFADWLDRGRHALFVADSLPGLSHDEAQSLIDHLYSVEPLAPVMLKH